MLRGRLPGGTEMVTPAAESRIPRRVVTGHDTHGVSVVLWDGPVPTFRHLPEDGVTFYEVWATDESPAPIEAVEADDPTRRSLRVPPEPGGSKIRINEFLPHSLDEHGLQSPVHRTESIDYGIVLEGEVVLLLDQGEVLLTAGDIVIQRGTDHAWANRSDAVCRVAFVLLDGTFTPRLRAILPNGAEAGLMREGPRT